MSIVLIPFSNGSLCHGNTWVVEDEAKLADQIARVALGQYRHVEKILAGTGLGPTQSTKSAAVAAVKLLTAVGDPWHRDGWMFQVMSWIAARTAAPGGIMTSPHMIHAHKGFDGLQLEIDPGTGQVSAVVIFEDKATDNPRDTIRAEVWSDFQKLEEGGQENVLTAQVVALLQTQPNIDQDLAVQNIIWKQARHYRVSITVSDSHSNDAGRLRLFREYDTVVAGPVSKRKGETFYVKALRTWMADLATKAIAAVQSKVTSSV